MMPYSPIAVGDDDEFYAFLQPGPDGEPLFIHLAGFAKDDFNKLVHEKKEPFTRLLNFDPERSHLMYTNKNHFGVRSDRRTYDVPEPESLDKFISNSTLSNIVDFYNTAEKLIPSS